ncbi:hypothetical protein VTN00DRAFT_6510 [Thermoascus crustaceus]|uniref:uncharacterized protein n=1 Tax=Thermoascus crustaceus TaxID=5088 RepID=UPI003742A4D8
MAERRGRERTAPFYPIPPREIVSVEHPAVIKNVDKAIDTLQGNFGISRILNPPRADTPASLVLRPEDAMSRPLQSTSSPSNNILLKVTVPKWTGRKRKRGSDEPFTAAYPAAETAGAQRRSAKDLLRSLRDNVGKYQVEAVGRVDRTHVFRGMPDFVFSTTASPFTNKFREHILPFDYEKMKTFDLDLSKGAVSNVDIVPPPSFSHGDVPFHYIYRQNPTVKQSVDTSGKVTTINTQQAAKVFTHLVPYDIPVVPSKPRDNCPPIETLERTLQETIAAVEALFAQRPAWTRRGLRNNLKTVDQRYCLRHAVAYVGYIFRSGPWRDAIIKFGHDPRTSPDYRVYQTFMFRILPREPEVARDGGGGRRHTLPRPAEASIDTSVPGEVGTSHVFTGQPPLPRDGRMWMVCDITDPILRRILFPEGGQPELGHTHTNPPPPNFLRSTCDIICDGWYGNGTLAKAKTIMRAKIQTLLQEDRPADDAEFVRILAFPDHAAVDDNSMQDFTLDPETATSREMQLATEVRATIKGAPSWRGMVSAGMDREHVRALETVESGPPIEGPPVSDGKRVKWEEDPAAEKYAEIVSEGEEEAREREEMMEEAAAAAAEAVEARVREREEAANEEEEAEDVERSEEDEDEDEDEDADDEY